METSSLFTVALNLESPWRVGGVNFVPTGDDAGSLELHIYLDYPAGSHFPCPTSGCASLHPVHDSEERTWRHLNFFQYKTFIHARLPRIRCKKHGAQTVQVSWARKGSGFTLLFEGFVLQLSQHQPVSSVARVVDEHDTRLWRFIDYYTDAARNFGNHSEVDKIGIDETCISGKKYVTITVDLERNRVLHVTEGKDSAAVGRFSTDFQEHGGDPTKIECATCDMSFAFLKGISENFPLSRRIIDKFHVIKQVNEAVDAVRKAEAKSKVGKKDLKKTKYLWLTNRENLSEEQLCQQSRLLKKYPRLARSCAIRVEFQDIYKTSSDRNEAEQRLRKLCTRMMRSRLEQMKRLCRTIRYHWNEILNYFDHQYTNAVLEGINNQVKLIKRRARGFRNLEYLKTMIFHVCGKFDYDAVLKNLNLVKVTR